MSKKFGFSFSWKRALGVSSAKANISRATGIPLTRFGRQRKIGQAIGCCVQIIILFGTSIITILGIISMVRAMQ